jgi:hypothetical protein
MQLNLFHPKVLIYSRKGSQTVGPLQSIKKFMRRDTVIGQEARESQG